MSKPPNRTGENGRAKPLVEQDQETGRFLPGDRGIGGRPFRRIVAEKAEEHGGEVAAPEPDKQAPNRLPNGRFAPGSTGNPKGRPRGRTLRGEIQGVLDTIDLDGSGSRLTARNVVARMLVRMAMAGDVRAAGLILSNEPRLDMENLPPSICPADTGRPDDAVNHFIAIGQLPAGDADVPEFVIETVRALTAEHCTEDVKLKLMTRAVQTYGSIDAFKEAVSAAAKARRDAKRRGEEHDLGETLEG